jgi:hypothetical protein
MNQTTNSLIMIPTFSFQYAFASSSDLNAMI